MKYTNQIINWINIFRCKKILRKNCNRKYKYEATICAIAKNEDIYLVEWIEHHLSLGFQHIYLLDNNDCPSLDSILSKYIKNNSLTIIDFRKIKPSNQIAAYTYCLINFGEDSHWMAFIDIDEFIVLKNFSSIISFLQLYVKYPSITVSWLLFGSNNKIYKEEGEVKERFPEPATGGIRLDEMNRYFKSIVQPVCFFQTLDCAIRSPHRWTFPAFDEHGKIVLGEQHKQTLDYIQINHYYTKSYEEFLHRCNNGKVQADGNIKIPENFFWVNDKSMKTAIENNENF